MVFGGAAGWAGAETRRRRERAGVRNFSKAGLASTGMVLVQGEEPVEGSNRPGVKFAGMIPKARDLRPSARVK